MGNTLIELMIVAGIIILLADLAIRDLIACRNKIFYKLAESDANGIAASMSDYFAVPIHNNSRQWYRFFSM